MPTQLSAVGLAAAVTLIVGLLGVALVVALARRSVGTAAVAAPVVVVVAVAAGVYASSRAMFLEPADSTTVLLVLLAAVPVAAVLGVLVARRVIAADRSARADRMAREQEARAEADRRELVAWVSHDLRTPLAGIQAVSEAVEDGVAPDVPLAMRQVQDSVAQMGELVDALLALSRLQAADPGLPMSEVDVGDLVSDTVAALVPLADAGGVRLTGSAGAGVRADVAAGEVRRAVANLVVNGIRHTPPGGEVTTTVARDGRCGRGRPRRVRRHPRRRHRPGVRDRLPGNAGTQPRSGRGRAWGWPSWPASRGRTVGRPRWPTSRADAGSSSTCPPVLRPALDRRPDRLIFETTRLRLVIVVLASNRPRWSPGGLQSRLGHACRRHRAAARETRTRWPSRSRPSSRPPGGRPPAGGHPHAGRSWRVLVTSLLVVVLDSSILNIALPTIQKDLGADQSQLLWAVDAYILVFAAAAVHLGCARRQATGRKRILTSA